MNKHKKYNLALKALLLIKHPLNIVVVGANDGKINDPVYSFVKKNHTRTKILLIEPLSSIIPYLKENYNFHPFHQVANCAIGKTGVLKLYAVKETYWDKFNPGYAKNWPNYRAATGITSALRSHLEHCLKRQNIDPNQSIEKIEIPSKSLTTVLLEQEWNEDIDVLQVDAEGYDDVVLYHSNIERTKPKLIYFESHNMPEDKSKLLLELLGKHKYKIYPVGGNSMAVKKSFSLWFLMVNFVIHKENACEKIKGLFKS